MAFFIPFGRNIIIDADGFIDFSLYFSFLEGDLKLKFLGCEKIKSAIIKEDKLVCLLGHKFER